MSSTQRAALSFRTRSIADLSAPDESKSGAWAPTGNGTTQTDVTAWQRAAATHTNMPVRAGMSEHVGMYQQPTGQFRMQNDWARAATSGGNFNPGDHRRKPTDVTRAGLK